MEKVKSKKLGNGLFRWMWRERKGRKRERKCESLGMEVEANPVCPLVVSWPLVMWTFQEAKALCNLHER